MWKSCYFNQNLQSKMELFRLERLHMASCMFANNFIHFFSDKFHFPWVIFLSLERSCTTTSHLYAICNNYYSVLHFLWRNIRIINSAIKNYEIFYTEIAVIKQLPYIAHNWEGYFPFKRCAVIVSLYFHLSLSLSLFLLSVLLLSRLHIDDFLC